MDSGVLVSNCKGTVNAVHINQDSSCNDKFSGGDLEISAGGTQAGSQAYQGYQECQSTKPFIYAYFLRSKCGHRQGVLKKIIIK